MSTIHYFKPFVQLLVFNKGLPDEHYVQRVLVDLPSSYGIQSAELSSEDPLGNRTFTVAVENINDADDDTGLSLAHRRTDRFTVDHPDAAITIVVEDLSTGGRKGATKMRYADADSGDVPDFPTSS